MVIDEAYLKRDFLQLVESAGSHIKRDVPINLLTPFIDRYKTLSVPDADRDYLMYTSGRRIWSDDPEDNEVEVIVLECQRVIEGYAGSDSRIFLSLSFDFDTATHPELGVRPFQSDWCVDKVQAASFLDHISTDPVFQALKDKVPLRTHLLSYRV